MGRSKYIYINKPRMAIDENGMRFDLHGVEGYMIGGELEILFITKTGREAVSAHASKEDRDEMIEKLDKYYHAFDLDRDEDDDDD